MIGIVIVGHGALPSEFVASLKHILGDVRQVKPINICVDDDMEEDRRDIQKAVASVDTGHGVIILTDMFGGTPSNLAISLLGGERKVEIIAGVNLPMLIKLVEIRGTCTFEEAIQQAQEAGRKYVHVAGNFLKEDH